MAWVVGDDHELLDRLVAHQEELAEAGNSDGTGVCAPEEGLLEEPLVEDDFQADPILDAGFDQELDNLSWVSLNQPGENKNERLHDGGHS